MSCLFCEIAAGHIPAAKIAENDDFLAFRDIHPQAPAHILVIPKAHFNSLSDVPGGELEKISSGLFLLAREVVKIEKLGEEGFRSVINTGQWGGQSVSHLHLHILGGRQLGPSMVG